MPAHHSVKVTAESTGYVLEASLPLLISILFQRGPGMKPLRRSPKASLCCMDPHQEGRENKKVKKGRESISTEKKLCFGHHVKCLNTSSHLILPQIPFCRWENRLKEVVESECHKTNAGQNWVWTQILAFLQSLGFSRLIFRPPALKHLLHPVNWGLKISPKDSSVGHLKATCMMVEVDTLETNPTS